MDEDAALAGEVVTPSVLEEIQREEMTTAAGRDDLDQALHTKIAQLEANEEGQEAKRVGEKLFHFFFQK